MKVTYTVEAVADIVEAITYLNERNSTAAVNLDADIYQRHPDQLLILRVYHQKRHPINR